MGSVSFRLTSFSFPEKRKSPENYWFSGLFVEISGIKQLTQKFIRKLHHLLMTGTVGEYREQLRPGEYRTVTSRPRDRELLHSDKIYSSLAISLRGWQRSCGQTDPLYVMPGHGSMPFTIDDKRRSRCLRGIKEWYDDRYELVDVVMEAQNRFAAQIELQKLYAHSRLYLPAGYKED